MNMELAGQRLADRGENEAVAEARFPTRYARFGAFQFDVERQDLIKNGTRLRLPGKVCQVLVTLLERPGEIVTREELRCRLWPSDTHVNFDANVNTTVNKLRQLLGDSNEQSAYVQTVPRKGYSFICQVEFLNHPDLAGANGDVAEGFPLAASAAPQSSLFGPGRARVWFTAGLIALVIAAMLLGAAITLFSRRPF